jgi:hypothetical protein
MGVAPHHGAPPLRDDVLAREEEVVLAVTAAQREALRVRAVARREHERRSVGRRARVAEDRADRDAEPAWADDDHVRQSGLRLGEGSVAEGSECEDREPDEGDENLCRCSVHLLWDRRGPALARQAHLPNTPCRDLWAGWTLGRLPRMRMGTCGSCRAAIDLDAADLGDQGEPLCAACVARSALARGASNVEAATKGAAATSALLGLASLFCGVLGFFLALAAVVTGLGAIIALRGRNYGAEVGPVWPVLLPACVGVAIGGLRILLFFALLVGFGLN